MARVRQATTFQASTPTELPLALRQLIGLYDTHGQIIDFIFQAPRLQGTSTKGVWLKFGSPLSTSDHGRWQRQCATFVRFNSVKKV